MKNNLTKKAQLLEQNPVYVAEELHKIIKIMISNMSFDSRQRAYVNLKQKFDDFNRIEISNKKSPGGAAIGVSLGLVKNVLNGKDPYFINIVINELIKRL